MDFWRTGAIIFVAAMRLPLLLCLIASPLAANPVMDGADPHAEVLCAHAVRVGKATQQQSRDLLAEHRKDGRTLGELFVERGIFTPKEWSDLYRQRQMLATLGSATAPLEALSTLYRGAFAAAIEG